MQRFYALHTEIAIHRNTKLIQPDSVWHWNSELTIRKEQERQLLPQTSGLHILSIQDHMSAAFSTPFMMMQRPVGSTTAFSIDSLIGGPPQPSPGHFVYTGYPMFMPYRSVVLPPHPPPPPPNLPQSALPPTHPHHPIPGLPSGFCSSLAQGMALTSTLMATLPGGFSASPSQQHQDVARKLGSQSIHAMFEKSQDIRLDGEDGKTFQAKDSTALSSFHDSQTVHTSTGEIKQTTKCSIKHNITVQLN